MILRLFGGKGGVGKTTCAAATARASARAGRRVLVVSTDPAHSLGDALDGKLGPRPRRVRVDGARAGGRLDAVELDADAALERWLGGRRDALRAIAARGTFLDDEDIERLLDLSLPGVDELVGLLEVARLAGLALDGEPASARRDRHDEVIVDTAPTGHTLRLLRTPETLVRIAGVLDGMQEKHRLLAASLGGRTRRDGCDDAIDDIDAEGRALTALLADPERTRFTWVALPEALSVEETRDGLAALAAAGVTVDRIVVNRALPDGGGGCPTCERRRAGERAAIAELVQLASAHAGGRVTILGALDEPPRGDGLDVVGRALERATPPRPRTRTVAARRGAVARATPPSRPPSAAAGAPPVLDELARLVDDGLRLIVVGGKGGVGKTTTATALALDLARRAPRRRTLLLSTDPAHSVGDALAVPLDDRVRPVAIPGARARLHARELDADRALARERERYRRAVDELFDALRGESRFDASLDRAVVRDLIDLAPPGLDELFALLSLVRALVEPAASSPSFPSQSSQSSQSSPATPARERWDLVVLDTAPTGHALRLLALPDAALAWVRALLAVLLKYRAAIGLGELAADLLATARELRELSALLTDGARCRFVAVARPEPLVTRETERLIAALARLGVPLGGLVWNATTAPERGCRRCGARARVEERAATALARRLPPRCAIIRAPAVAPPPRGAAALLGWLGTWGPAGP